MNEVNFFKYLNQRVLIICKESFSVQNGLKILLSAIFCKALSSFVIKSSLEGPLKGRRFSKQKFKMSILEGVFYKPFGEEIFFRGFFLLAIREVQLIYYKFVLKKNLLPKELQRLEKRRVWTVAVMFGFFHLLNIYRSFPLHVLKVTLTTFSGLGFGYLAERSQSIYLSVFAHGVNNGFSYWLTYRMSTIKNKNLTELVVLSGSIAIKLFFYLYATGRIKPFKMINASFNKVKELFIRKSF